MKQKKLASKIYLILIEVNKNTLMLPSKKCITLSHFDNRGNNL